MEDEVSKILVAGDCRGVSPAEALLDLMSRPETGYGPDTCTARSRSSKSTAWPRSISLELVSTRLCWTQRDPV